MITFYKDTLPGCFRCMCSRSCLCCMGEHIKTRYGVYHAPAPLHNCNILVEKCSQYTIENTLLLF